MTQSLDYRNELNPEQIRAVETTEGPLLIIAGAGSGKTRVITYRIANLLARGISQRAIMALTFTNKAAREMRERVKELTGRPLRNLTCSTFHAFGVTVLRNHIHRLGYRSNFSIYDTQDQLSLLKETAREVKFALDPGETKWLLGEFSRIRTGRGEWDEDLERYRDLFTEYREHMKLYNA
ncbi:MAG: UvrD-helicase domain-containing protein, partial [Spirochaetaceae bacterium]